MDPLVISAIVFANLVTLLSLGFTLTYMTTKIPNFAHGTLAILGAFISYTGYLNGHSPYYYLPIAFLLLGGLSLFTYKGVLSTLKKRKATTISLTISTLALELIFISFINVYADYIERARKMVAHTFVLRVVDFDFLGFPGILITSSIIAVITILFLHLLLTRTQFGIAMRAAVEDPSLAEILGVDVELIYAVSWFLTGGLNGLAGCVMPLWFRVDPSMGPRLTITIFAAGILGGLVNIYGTMLGGYIIGLSEILLFGWLTLLWGSWIAPYRLLVPLAVMSVVLLFSPEGIIPFLRQVATRVRMQV